MQINQESVNFLSRAVKARSEYHTAIEALEKAVGREICDESLADIIDFDFAGRETGVTTNEASEILNQLI